MIKLCDKKYTPNQFAKRIVVDYMESACYFEERFKDEFEQMTDKERDEVRKYAIKQIERVVKLMGGWCG